MAAPKKLKDSLPGMWRLTLYFWPQARKHGGLMVVSLLALLAEVGLRLLEPWPLKFVFDYIIGAGTGPAATGVAGVQRFAPTTLLTLAAFAFVAITGLRALAAYTNTIGFARIGHEVLVQVRSQLYRHVQYLSLSFHTKSRTGDLVVRVISDVGMLQDAMVTALLPILARLLIVAGMLGLMFWLNWQLALVAISVLPLLYLRTVKLSGRIRETAQKQRLREGAMAATVAEAIHGIRTVQALSLESRFADAFASNNERSLREGMKGKRLAASLERSVDVLVALAGALVLWQGTRLVLNQSITAGDLLVFLAYLKYAYRPAQDFAKYTGRLAKASAAGDRVLDLLSRVPTVTDLPGAVPAPRLQGAVRFEGVHFCYEPGQPCLEEITFGIEPGRRVALVGASGSGKSSLASLLLRLYDPQLGRVRIDGRDLREFTLESLRAQMSVVLQDNLLFAASIQDNIACAAEGASQEEIEAAARLANAHDFIINLPQGYDTVLGERGVTLSQGQRQRIAIARAALRQAPILILDEPTTGLDRNNAFLVMEALGRLARGCTTFLITHDLDQVKEADLILVLEQGQILERGTHAELMALGGRYASTTKLHAPAAVVVLKDPASVGASGNGSLAISRG